MWLVGFLDVVLVNVVGKHAFFVKKLAITALSTEGYRKFSAIIDLMLVICHSLIFGPRGAEFAKTFDDSECGRNAW